MAVFETKMKWGNFSGNINIYRDLKKSDISKLAAEKNIHSVQFYQFINPKRKTWAVLNEFYREHPQIGLRVHWYDQINFDFYAQLTSLKNIDISSFNTSDYTPLLQNRKLTDLGIGKTKSSVVDLSFIGEFTKLTTLYIDGMKKGLESASELSKLERLTLRGVKMNNLSLIENLKNLKQLRLLFGSYKDLDSIATSKSLKTLELSRARQIPNYDFFEPMDNLNSLYLEGMSKMEKLPSLSGLKNLKRFQIDNNSRLIDITNINQLSRLEIFILTFPENFKSEYRKKVISQALDFLLNSNTIKYTNLYLFLNKNMKEKLRANGIQEWHYSLNL
jgi:uncharacterized protein YcfL